MEGNNKAIEGNNKAIEDNRKAIEGNNKAIEDNRKAIERNDKVIADNRKAIEGETAVCWFGCAFWVLIVLCSRTPLCLRDCGFVFVIFGVGSL